MKRKLSDIYKHFDEVYLVNLAQDRQKRIRSLNHLRKHNIFPTVWKATNGYRGETLTAYNRYKQQPIGGTNDALVNKYENQINRKLIESPGAFGYLKTYSALIEHALSTENSRILVLEDDVILCDNFEDKFKRFISQINRNWLILQLGASQYNWANIDIKKAKDLGYYDAQPIDTCGSFAIGINLDIGKELLTQLRKMNSPFDHLAIGYLYKKYPGQCLVAYPNLVIADVSKSSIRSARSQIQHGRKMKWDLKQFNLSESKPSFTIIFQNPTQFKRLDLILFESYEINWIYNVNGLLRPVHNQKSPVLSIEPNGRIKTNHEIYHLLAHSYNGKSILNLDLNFPSDYDLLDLLERLVADKTTTDDQKYLLDIPYQNKETGEEKVTIIIPTYKRAEHLENAIESVLSQTYKNTQVVVVDDNEPFSEQRKVTYNRIKKYIDNNQIKYFENDVNIKLNAASARNLGILNTAATYVGFLDDDDIYTNNKVSDCLDKLTQTTAEIGAVYGGFLGIQSSEDNKERYKSGDLTYDILSLNYKAHYLNTDTALYKRAALLKINGYDDTFDRHQDLELNIRFFEHFKISTVDRTVAKIRPYKTATSNLLKGEDLFKLKLKFLRKFSDQINSLDTKSRLTVYKNHWEEVKKYYQNDSKFYSEIMKHDLFGFLNFIREEQNLIAQESNIIVSNGDEEKFDSEGEKALIWYRETFEHLPKWYIKLGGIFRRWPFGNKSWF